MENLYKDYINAPIKTELGCPARFSNSVQANDPALNIPGYIAENRVNLEDNVNIDTYLRQPGVYCRSKNNFGASQDDAEATWRVSSECNPLLMLYVPRRKDLDWSNYIRTAYKGPGHGFGNTDINNYVTYSESTRQIYTEHLGDIEQNRFYDLNRNYMDPKHIVLPFPVGGIDTRNLDKYTRKVI